VNATVWSLVALSAGVALNVTFLQRGTAANWAVRGRFQPVAIGANTEARPETSANPSDGTLTFGQYSPVAGLGGHDGRPIGGIVSATPSPQPGSTVRDFGRTAEGPSNFAASNGVDVIRAVQRELGRRGYKPGIPSGVANVATRGAIMAYQRDHGLPLTGEPSDALLQAIVFGSSATVRGPGNSVSTERGGTVGDVVRTAESASTFTASNGVDVIRAVQRELGQRGYKPGIPNGMANAATRGAIMAYQRDHGLPLTGEPSEALLTAIVFDSSGAARVPGNSIGKEHANHEVPMIRAVIKSHSSTSRSSQRTTQVALRGCGGAGRGASRSTCERNSFARAKEPHGAIVPSARVAIDAAHLSVGWTGRPRVHGREVITGSTTALRPATSSGARKPMSEQKYLHSAVGSSGLASLIWTQFSTAPAVATTVPPSTPTRVAHHVHARQPGTSETRGPRARPVPNSPLTLPGFPEVIR
jgi:peptidoglycan hydrolase-like protein with peptidoglycan-binding domain